VLGSGALGQFALGQGASAAGEVVDAVAALAGAGTLQAVGLHVALAAAPLVGTGSLTALGQRIVFGQALLTGLGGAVGDGSLRRSGMAVLSGTGSLAVLAATLLPNLANGVFAPPFVSMNTVLESITAVRRFEAEAGNYEQRVADGLHSHDGERWQIRMDILEAADADEVWAFLKARQGLHSFLWTPPHEASPKRYVADQLARRRLGNGDSAITCRFRRVFDIT
jgi:phage-related protein